MKSCTSLPSMSQFVLSNSHRSCLQLPSPSYSPISSCTPSPISVYIGVVPGSEAEVTYEGMSKKAAVIIKGKNTRVSGIWSGPVVAESEGRLERAQAGGVFLVKTGIDKGGVSGTVERGTAVVSSFCHGVTVPIEWEVEDSGRVGVNAVIQEMGVTVWVVVSMWLLFHITKEAGE